MSDADAGYNSGYSDASNGIAPTVASMPGDSDYVRGYWLGWGHGYRAHDWTGPVQCTPFKPGRRSPVEYLGGILTLALSLFITYVVGWQPLP